MTILFLHFCPDHITFLSTLRHSLSWEIYYFGIGHGIYFCTFLIPYKTLLKEQIREMTSMGAYL